MLKYREEKQLCFDDVLMVPQYSEISSRSEIDLRMPLGKDGSYLELPVIASPMDTVCEDEMAIAMAKAGGLGIIHRFMPIQKQALMVSRASYDGLAIGAAVGAKNNYLQDTETLINAGASLILIDTANGHNRYAVEALRNIKERFNIHVMAGNVSTAIGFQVLVEAGADSVRVGIGGGSVCTTRLVSGHGIPTLASIMDIKSHKEDMGVNTSIVADGGIRNTGDMIKAFAAGADIVMLGSMLSGTDESPGDVISNEQGTFKIFRGMASKEANEGKDIPVAEGVSTLVHYKGSVNNILNNIRGGLGSGCSYSGVSRLIDLYDESMYVEVSSLSVTENRPHAML